MLNETNAPTTETTAETVAAPAPIRNEDGTITAHVSFTLPANIETRKALAEKYGFKEVGDVRKNLKNTDAKIVEAAKNYIKDVKESAEKLEVTLTYPAVDALKPEELQDLIYSRSYFDARANLLASRRKNEELQLSQRFSIYDLQGGTEDEGDEEYDKDAVLPVLDSFVKENGFNESTTVIVSTAIIGSTASMLKVRKFFAAMERSLGKFAAYAAEKSDVDFDEVSKWLKRQNKRLARAMSTPEITETEITI